MSTKGGGPALQQSCTMEGFAANSPYGRRRTQHEYRQATRAASVPICRRCRLQASSRPASMKTRCASTGADAPLAETNYSNACARRSKNSTATGEMKRAIPSTTTPFGMT